MLLNGMHVARLDYPCPLADALDYEVAILNHGESGAIGVASENLDNAFDEKGEVNDCGQPECSSSEDDIAI